jgi:MFS family permease
MGQAATIEMLTLLTMIVWFVAGINISMVNILTGLFADSKKRGWTFGIIGLSNGLAAILGGLLGGTVMERWGFVTLVTVVALSQIVLLIASRFLEDGSVERTKNPTASAAQPSISSSLLILIVASTLVNIAQFVVGLARSLAMDQLGFEASALSSVAVITGMISLPLPFVIGWLSDRMERKQLLILAYLGANLGAVILLAATDLLHFWLSAGLFASLGGASIVGSALITDLVPRESLGRALSHFGATAWYGGVIGYMSAGFIIQSSGLQSAFTLSAMLPALAVALILSATYQARRKNHRDLATHLQLTHITQEIPRV